MSPHLFPMAHEHVGDVDGVVHGDGVAAADGTEEADGDDELQDSGHSTSEVGT